MKNILSFIIAIAMFLSHADGAVRDGNATQRGTQKRISTTPITERATTGRTSVLVPVRNTVNRATAQSVTTRATSSNVVNRAATVGATQNVTARAATPKQTLVSETRTGAAYETCKSAFFTCMDQFCALKNDDYRRCSCSKRVSDMEKQRKALTDAGEKLTVFTENLDVVGLTAAQATAMRTASEGESALSTDTSASKALLQAIMNSITGGDTTVGGKYSDLNTINMSYDLTTAFGTDANQIVASYNGQDLYSAVYPQCRRAVADDCNSASLQRAVNAYLMAIEQDCNTVQTAIEERRSQMKSAIREGSAMLDLARVENRRNHNSDDITTCINNVEAAILSEEVCGANYHKCLDNGEFIDIATGAPITGIVKFYELGNLLTFTPGIDAANQQLSKRSSNRIFVSNFEKRTKKFAEPALDKCTEIADEVWSEYLDKAMLSIYYAQQSKVSEIKQGCFDFVSQCYTDSDGSITAAMSELIGSGLTILTPDKIALTTQMCTDYVESCNNMFDGNIVADYVNNRQDTDTLTACRAVVKQCFDKYGGTGYENFYYPYSGLFKTGSAGDWFTLYDKTNNNALKSPCARQLAEIDACSDFVEQAFGGFDYMYTIKSTSADKTDQLSFTYLTSSAQDAVARYGMIQTGTTMRNRVLRPTGVATEVYNQIIDTLSTQCTNLNGRFVERQFIKENIYGGKGNTKNMCMWYPKKPTDNSTNTENLFAAYKTLATMYGIFTPSTSDENQQSTEIIIPEDFIGEDMCPRDYNLNVDTSFWGACLCWENGARRSKNGKNATCVAELPVLAREDTVDVTAPTTDPATGETTDPATGETTDPATGETTDQTTTETTITHAGDSACYATESSTVNWLFTLGDSTSGFYDWCSQNFNSYGQVCPYGYVPAAQSSDSKNFECTKSDDSGETFSETGTQKTIYKILPESIYQNNQ